MAEKKTQETQEKATVIEVAEPEEPEYVGVDSLDRKQWVSGDPGKATTVTPVSQTQEDRKLKTAEHAADSLLSYTKRPLPDGDELLSVEDWLRKHMNRIAGFDVKPVIKPHRWIKDVLDVEVQGTPGSISISHIQKVRARRDLRAVDLAIGRGWMSGFLPELANFAEW
jgi:hypothetical protein